MGADINVVVGCTDRKSTAVPGRTSLGSFSGTDRFDAWAKALEHEPKTHHALELYAGDAWAAAASLPTEVQGFSVKRWVVSAGWGLLPFDEQIAPYAATFSGGHRDSVGDGGKQANRSWWERLTGWRPTSGPRSLSELATADARGKLVVALSARYLDAVWDDLEEATAESPGVLVLGSKSPRGANVIPCDARIVTTVGGSRVSMNNRALAHLLATAGAHQFEASAVRSLFQEVLEKGQIERFNRSALSDEAILDFIRQLRASDPALSRTRALRKLRTEGNACEQKRFASLWEQAA